MQQLLDLPLLLQAAATLVLRRVRAPEALRLLLRTAGAYYECEEAVHVHGETQQLELLLLLERARADPIVQLLVTLLILHLHLGVHVERMAPPIALCCSPRSRWVLPTQAGITLQHVVELDVTRPAG
jgi:hypothetical protein